MHKIRILSGTTSARLAIGLALAAIVALLLARPLAGQTPAFKVLVFSRTVQFRHASIDEGIAMVRALGTAHNFAVDATENPAAFTDANLQQYQVVIFLSTTGDVLDNNQQAAFERFIRSGRGYVGIHAASDTEYDWPWYGGLVGAYFGGHPPGTTSATIDIENTTHPSTAGLPARWERVDEWYSFRTNPRGQVQVLATLDETTYDPGQFAMGEDHPIAWYHSYDGGRAWYTAGGHTESSYSEPLFRQHVLGGIRWAAGVAPPPTPTRTPGPTPTPFPRNSITYLPLTFGGHSLTAQAVDSSHRRCRE